MHEMMFRSGSNGTSFVAKSVSVMAMIFVSIALAHAAPPPAIPIFSDDFESGSMSLWTPTAANPSPLEISTTRNIVPAGGRFSALMNTSIDRMHRNIIADNGGVELGGGGVLFTFWMYDLGTNSGTVGATRVYNEIRAYSGGTGLPNGGTTASGTLSQLLAVGKFNSVTLPGDTFTTTKYQGRVAFGPGTGGTTGWMNLNGPGSPNRSVGWHRFDIEVMPGGTTVRFYVDGILSRTFNGATADSFDTVILGPGLGSQLGDAWFDGVFIGRVDNPPVITCPSNITAAATSAAGAVVNYTVTATDDLDTNLTVVCNPPSGSTFPIGMTTVNCSATDDFGNIARCTFIVTVTPPVIFEGFQVYPKGQATVQPDASQRRLEVRGIGSSGQDGVDVSLRQVDGINVVFVPYDYLAETCTASAVQIEIDGMPARLRTELALGPGLTTAMADFAALGSTESEIEIRGANNQLLNRYRVPNGTVIDVEKLFEPCTNNTVVYSYFQGPDLAWYRFCKPTCYPCVGTNCWVERTVCIRGIIQAPRAIALTSLQMCFATPGSTTITVEDLQFMELGNDHHAKPEVLVDGSGPGLRMNIEGIARPGLAHRGGVSVRPPNHDPAARIDVELLPLNLAGAGPAPAAFMLEAMGTVNGSPNVSLGTASLQQLGGPANALQMTADFSALGATMVRLEVLNGGMPVGRLILPMGNIGTLSGDGLLRTCGKLPPRPPCFWTEFDRQMSFTGSDGSTLAGDEFRILAADPTVQVQLLESLCLMAANVDFTILRERIQSAGEVFFPDDVFPPPTATWATFPTTVHTYGGGGGAGGRVALRNMRLSFFDVFAELPAPGAQTKIDVATILEADISHDGQAFECGDLRGRMSCVITGGPAMGDLRYFDIEILALDLAHTTRPIRLRENPIYLSHGQHSARRLPGGGYMVDSFFDVFTELSLDGGSSWIAGNEAAHLEVLHYDVGPFPTPTLPQARGSYSMQCPPVEYLNQVIIRNLTLMGLTEGRALDSIPLGGSAIVESQGVCHFEHSDDGGATWRPEQAECRATFTISHVLEYSGTAYFDTEMLQLNLSGGTLPGGIRLRESPTRRSEGRTCYSQGDGGVFQIASFFDVFTELTLDGGQLWAPAGRPARLTVGHDNCLSIRCPQDIRVWTCEQGATVNYSVTATSACGTVPTIQCMPPSGSVFPVGSTTVNCRAIDAAGNTAFCSFKVVVVQDSAPPVIQCPTEPILRWICTNGTPTHYPVTATDDCDTNVTIVCNPPSGSPLPPGDHTVVCDAIDDCGKRAQCQFRVIVRADTEPPRIDCPSNIVVWTCSPNGANVGYTVSATDDCDPDVELTCTPPPGPFPVGTTTVNCRAVDDCNRVSTCTFTVTVRQDTEPPKLFCPSNIVAWTCSPNGMPITYTVTATDDCDPNPAIQCVPPSGSNFPIGTTTVNCRAIDACDRASACEFTVTIRHDTTGPRVVCPGNITNWVCSADGEPLNFAVTATDDCDPSPSIVCNPPSGSVFPPGTTVVDCIATDACGNKDQCRFLVVVRRDTEPPRLDCPPRIDICTCSPNGTNVTYNVRASDDCDTNVTIVCTPPSGSHFPPGTHTVTCTARDDCGNTSDCSFQVVVTVNTVAITCPPDLSVLTCSNTAVVNYTVGATNQCGGGNVCLAPTNDTGTARLPVDCPLSSTETMHIVDGLPAGTTIELAPVLDNFVCPPGAPPCALDCFLRDDCNYSNGAIVAYGSTLQLTLHGTGELAGFHRVLSIPNATAIEQHAARMPAAAVQSFATDLRQLFAQLPPGDPDFDFLRIAAGTEFGMPSPGHTTLTLISTGSGLGWVVDSFFDITYRIDFIGRAGGPLSGRSGSTTGTIRVRPSVPPNAPSVVCNPPSGSSFPVGTTTVTCVATNECGFRDSCQFKVTVAADQEPPRIVCPNGILDWTCTNGAVVTYTVAATDDVDTNVTITCNPPSGSVFPVGTTVVTCVATDDCGNTDRCEFPVRIIRDTEPPVITCPTNFVVWGCSNRIPVIYTVTTSDDCDTNVEVSCTLPDGTPVPSGTALPPGQYPITCAAKDDCGGVSSCTFVVRVIEDTKSPVIRCPTNTVVWACTNRAPLDYTVTATDDCDPDVSIVCNPPPGTLVPVPGIYNVTCVATDDCGNQDRCEFIVRMIRDDSPPTIVCPTNRVVWVCTDSWIADYGVIARDDCDTNVTIECIPPEGTPLPPGVHTVACRAVDDCGNTAGCQFVVRVIYDNTPPTLDCPTNIVVQTCWDDERVVYRVDARDDCDTNVTIRCNPPSGTFFPVGTNQVQCVAIDDCGNRSQCRFDVIVIKMRPPRLTIRKIPGTTDLAICWPAPSTGFRLQCTPSLNPPIAWTTITNAPQLIGGTQWCVRLPNIPRHRFYRLCKPPRPTITSVRPLNPRPNDILFIDGSGFGDRPDDLCVAIAARPPGPNPAGLVPEINDEVLMLYPLRALFASENFMTARMPGALPPDVQPGKLMVGHGTGQSGRFRPAFFDIFVIDDVWTWSKGDSDGMGDEVVQPQPAPPPPNECWFFSGEPSNGQLCVFLDPACPWPSNAIVSITARAHDSVTGAGGYDLDGPTIRFVGGGTVRECADRIADVLRCAFLQQAGVTVAVSVDEDPATGLIKITVRILGGYIDRGFLQICVRGGNDPVITSVNPRTGGQGDLISIRGANFGNNPDNLCVVAVDGAAGQGVVPGSGRRFIPLQVVQSSDNQILARLGPVPPGAQPGPIMVGRGQGATGRFRPAFFDIFVDEPVWTWRKNGEGAGLSPEPFHPQPDPPPPPSNCWFYSQAPVEGKLCVFLDPDCPWPSNAVVTVIARAHDSVTGAGGVDLAAPNVRFVGGGTLVECADRIKDILRCAFLQQAGVNIEVACDLLADGRVKLTVAIPGGYIDRGMLTICVGPAPAGGP